MPITLSGTSGGVGVIGASTAQNTTSGTSVVFTGIPSGVRRITVMLNSISTTGTNPFIIQLGTSGGFVTTGYASTGSSATTGVGTNNTTVGLIVVASPPSGGSGATGTYSGLMTICQLDSTIWTSSASLGQDGVNHSTWAAGRASIAGTVTQLRLTTTTGVDTYDSGSMNIFYE